MQYPTVDENNNTLPPSGWDQWYPTPFWGESINARPIFWWNQWCPAPILGENNHDPPLVLLQTTPVFWLDVNEIPEMLTIFNKKYFFEALSAKTSKSDQIIT